MTENKARQPAGIPVGGQFAPTAHTEPTDVRLRRTTADEDREYAIDHLESRDFDRMRVSDEDTEILGRALRREPVTAEEVDAALERNWEAEYPGPDDDIYYSGIATQVFDEVRADRAASVIPSTLPTMANFDPATASVFETDEARRDPVAGLSALTASIGESEYRMSRAAEHQKEVEYLERSNEAPGRIFRDDTRPTAARAAGALAGAARADAKAAAIITEMRWLIDNDEEYAKDAGPAVAAVMTLDGLQPDVDPNTPIAPSIRTVQARA